MKQDKKTIHKIIGEVKDQYPFPDIIQETADTIRSLAVVLGKLAPTGGRLLDIGCGMNDVGSRSPDPASGDGRLTG